MGNDGPVAGHSRRRGPRRGLANRLRHLFGLRQVFIVDGVRYREVTVEPLRHALSRKGPGFKEFDVAFPGGAAGTGGGVMRIRCTPRRVFADLSAGRLVAVCDAAGPLLRPGMRVLLLEGGTGDAGAFLGRRVAPSGAVVSLDGDTDSIEYAQKRYRLQNVSYEVGGIDGLAGETDGAFDAVIAVEPGAMGVEAPGLAEAWRVVRAGGWLMLAGERPVSEVEASAREACAAAESVSLPADGRDGWSLVVAVKPREAAPRHE